MTTNPEEKALLADAYQVKERNSNGIRRIRLLRFNVVSRWLEQVDQVGPFVSNGSRQR